MRNGCPECSKLPDDEFCEMCELGYLEWEYERARNAYRQKIEESITKEREDLSKESKMFEKTDTGCEQHHLEYLSEEARIAVSQFEFALLKKIVEMDRKIKEIRE